MILSWFKNKLIFKIILFGFLTKKKLIKYGVKTNF
jgi:hypothetical protein